MKTGFHSVILNECAFATIIDEEKPTREERGEQLLEAYDNGEISLKTLCEEAGCTEEYEAYRNGEISEETLLNEVSGAFGALGNFFGGAARRVRQGVADFKTNMNNQRQLARNYERERRRNQRAVNRAAREENRRRRNQFNQNPDAFVDADFSNGQMDQRDKFADEHAENYDTRQDDLDAAEDDNAEFDNLGNPPPAPGGGGAPNPPPGGGDGGGTPNPPPGGGDGGGTPNPPPGGGDNGGGAQKNPPPAPAPGGGDVAKQMQNLSPEQQQAIMKMIQQMIAQQPKQLNAPQGQNPKQLNPPKHPGAVDMVQGPDGTYQPANGSGQVA